MNTAIQLGTFAAAAALIIGTIALMSGVFSPLLRRPWKWAWTATGIIAMLYALAGVIIFATALGAILYPFTTPDDRGVIYNHDWTESQVTTAGGISQIAAVIGLVVAAAARKLHQSEFAAEHGLKPNDLYLRETTLVVLNVMLLILGIILTTWPEQIAA